MFLNIVDGTMETWNKVCYGYVNKHFTPDIATVIATGIYMS